jgi:TPP-dependent pyruvate/acetoin dehydrogenase alpha subunit
MTKTLDALQAYRLMLTSRAIDDACTRTLAEGAAVPNYHSARGQEALVALGLVLDGPDYLQFTYRDFAPLLAKGLSLERLVADLRLKSGGTTEGFGGIMHVAAPELGVVGRNSVFGSRFGIAVGLAVSAQLEGAGRVVMCPYGEAEGGRGPLYEAINFACLRSLPVIFVAENNGFSISARTSELYAGGDMSSMWRGMPMPVSAVDGNDVAAVYAATEAAVLRAREGLGPSLVETLTYRIDAHFPTEADFLGRFDYRTDAEIDLWRARDPIERTEQRLIADALIDAAGVSSLRQEVADLVDETFAGVAATAAPDPEGVYRYRYRAEVPERTEVPEHV